MNTNSNIYTVIYTTVLVIVVAAILAFAATSLAPKQDANVKVETITKILASVGVATDGLSNDEIIAKYSSLATDAFYVNADGEVVSHFATSGEGLTLASKSDLKRQQAAIVKGEALSLPVYVFGDVTVFPVYGAGLWGPIWGYVALESDLCTVKGAIFDHQGETPGLGAKIAEEPFYSQFAGKKIFDGENFTSIKVVKGGANGDIHGVDAVSGATITSTAVNTSVLTWLSAYMPYIVKHQTTVEE